MSNPSQQSGTISPTLSIVKVEPDRKRLRAAFCDKRLSPIDRCVWVLLSAYANEENTCWPHARTLAADLGIHEKTVASSLRALRKAGLIQRFSRPSGQLAWFLRVNLTDWSTLPATAPAAQPATTTTAPAPVIRRYPSPGSDLVRTEEPMDSSGAEGLQPRSPWTPTEEPMGSTEVTAEKRLQRRGGSGAPEGAVTPACLQAPDGVPFPPPSAAQSSEPPARSAEHQLVDRVLRAVNVTPPKVPSDGQLAGARMLLEQHQADEIVELCTRAVRANEKMRGKVLSSLVARFQPEDWPKVQAAAGKASAKPAAEVELDAEERKRQADERQAAAQARALAENERMRQAAERFRARRAAKAAVNA